MRSNIIVAVLGGIFTLCVFLAGGVFTLYFKHTSVKNSYTQEYIESGRVMLFALRELERGEANSARDFLKEQVLQTVTKINSNLHPPTPQRDIDQTKQFYKEVANYLSAIEESPNEYSRAVKLVLDKHSSQNKEQPLLK